MDNVTSRKGSRTRSPSPKRSSGLQPPRQPARRGRSASPKRSRAPLPPGPVPVGPCPSPVAGGLSNSLRDIPSTTPAQTLKNVSVTDIRDKCDIQGWLREQIKGRKMWCAVAERLFYVFEKETAAVSKQVIHLPGCKVRQMDFKTVVHDGRKKKGRKNRVDRLQFWIENLSCHQTLMFGVDNEDELKAWITVINNKISDQEVFRYIDNGEIHTVIHKESPQVARVKEMNEEADQAKGHVKANSFSNYAVNSLKLPWRPDYMTLQLPRRSQVTKGSVEDIRKSLRREQDVNSQDNKSIPLKVAHTDMVTASPGRQRSLLRSGIDFFKTRKRSSSADDARDRSKLAIDHTETVPVNQTPPPTGHSEHSTGEQHSQTQSPVSDAAKHSGGFGANLRRSASVIKAKLFSSASKLHRSETTLADIKDCYLQGHLLLKTDAQWSKIWAIVAQQHFYGYKSQQNSEVPMIEFPLTRCKITSIQEMNLQQQKYYTFTLTHPQGRPTQLATDTHLNFSRWLQCLQLEACTLLPNVTLTRHTDNNHDAQEIENSNHQDINNKVSWYLKEEYDTVRHTDENRNFDEASHLDPQQLHCFQAELDDSSSVSLNRDDLWDRESQHQTENSDDTEDDRKLQDNSRKSNQTKGSLEIDKGWHRGPEDTFIDGYLSQRLSNNVWKRYWFVLKDHCLYSYHAPDDPVTVDVIHLTGYTLTSLVDKYQGHSFVLYLEHQTSPAFHLSASTREEFDEWQEAVAVELKESDEQHKIALADPQISVRQRLLAELLRQTQELEKRQAARRRGEILSIQAGRNSGETVLKSKLKRSNSDRTRTAGEDSNRLKAVSTNRFSGVNQTRIQHNILGNFSFNNLKTVTKTPEDSFVENADSANNSQSVDIDGDIDGNDSFISDSTHISGVHFDLYAEEYEENNEIIIPPPTEFEDENPHLPSDAVSLTDEALDHSRSVALSQMDSSEAFQTLIPEHKVDSSLPGSSDIILRKPAQREVNPKALADIQDFEELSREVLESDD